jgi:hypothetical protein
LNAIRGPEAVLKNATLGVYKVTLGMRSAAGNTCKEIQRRILERMGQSPDNIAIDILKAQRLSHRLRFFSTICVQYASKDAAL